MKKAKRNHIITIRLNTREYNFLGNFCKEKEISFSEFFRTWLIRCIDFEERKAKK